MENDVRLFPLNSQPVEGELEALRSEFIQYQYRYSPFSDHYSVVARFAWEKIREAIAPTPTENSNHD